MQFGKTWGTRKIVKAYPGLEGASVGSIFVLAIKLLFRGKLFTQLKKQKDLDAKLTQSIKSIDFGGRGAVVQIGANDGQHSDPIRDILAANDTKAVLVEPIPIAFKALSKLYADKPSVTLVNAAISTNGKPLVLYVPEIKGSELQSTLWACTSREQAMREVQRIMGHKILKKTKVVKHSIKSLSGAQLCKTAGLKPTDIKVLICDTEGQDAGIINSFLDAGTCPEIIFYEKLHVDPTLSAELNTRLEGLGYNLEQSNKDVYATKADGVNTLGSASTNGWLTP